MTDTPPPSAPPSSPPPPPAVPGYLPYDPTIPGQRPGPDPTQRGGRDTETDGNLMGKLAAFARPSE